MYKHKNKHFFFFPPEGKSLSISPIISPVSFHTKPMNPTRPSVMYDGEANKKEPKTRKKENAKLWRENSKIFMAFLHSWFAVCVSCTCSDHPAP